MGINQKTVFQNQVILFAAFALFSGAARSEIRPEKIHVSDSKKTETYIDDGLIMGGDRAINNVVIKDIRRALNPGFERVVLDLESQQTGESIELPRAPYFQLAINSEENRMIMTLWGQPKLGFDSKKVVDAFKKSKIVKNIVLLPRIEDDSWTFVFELIPHFNVEVFELKKPVRLILDIQQKKA
ncbi:MAG: hypothetical protein ABIQ95_15195 [Bdellovibrionia bacterium]